MQTITRQTLAELAAKAATVPRRRCNLNMHGDPSDPIQRMLNSGQPDSYIRPHRHDGGRWESFVLLQGTLAVLTFDDGGTITTRTELRPNQTLITEIPGGVWHSLLFLEPASTAFELKPGPYRAEHDKQFAPWSPAENTPAAPALAHWLLTAQVGQVWRG